MALLFFSWATAVLLVVSLLDTPTALTARALDEPDYFRWASRVGLREVTRKAAPRKDWPWRYYFTTLPPPHARSRERRLWTARAGVIAGGSSPLDDGRPVYRLSPSGGL